MSKPGLFSFVSACVALLYSLVVNASGVHPHSADATAALIELLRPLEAMQGSFTQVQSTVDGEEISRSSGVFAIQRPAKLRWQTTDPFPQLLVSDGSTLWLYDPDLEQVTVSAVTDQLEQTPAVIFSGDLEAIEASYYVTRSSGDTEGQQSFILTPRQERGQFQRLELLFDSNNQLSGMIALDGFAQRTQFRFRDVAYNGPVNDQQFVFTPPPGTDILRHD